MLWCYERRTQCRNWHVWIFIRLSSQSPVVRSSGRLSIALSCWNTDWLPDWLFIYQIHSSVCPLFYSFTFKNIQSARLNSPCRHLHKYLAICGKQLDCRVSELMLFKNTFKFFQTRSIFKTQTSSAAAVTGIRSMASAGILAATIVAPKQALPVPEDVHLKSHHQKNGRFDNPWPSFRGMEPLKIMPAMLTSRIRDGIPDTSKEENKFKIIKPDFLKTRVTDITQLRCTWLGHACALIEFPGGLRVLFDPVFCNRCSPSQWLGPARQVARYSVTRSCVLSSCWWTRP